MAYTVLARKYRSRTFDEVVGQGPIATTLANAIRAGRIHHGYLFTGTRGTGKTSMARILAKSLNCLAAEGPTVTPCCECDACRAISEGQDLDVIEIDAASNTGVDNIRELRSNTSYRPARCRFKIYIIDEVHMLSTGAFNALLKTLEEPPEHVKFILATTEIQKVPATIQSRCQRFNFRNISADEIAGRLAQIVSSEGASAEPEVLRRVARLAAGSMRDALSILDQLLSVAPQNLSLAALEELLPPAHDEQALAVLAGAAVGDAAAALAAVDAGLSRGRALDVFCGDLVEAARLLMLLRVCGPDSPVVDLPAAARQEYVALAARFEPSHYVQMVAMLEELRRNVRFSAAGRALADAVVVRMAHLAQWSPIEALLAPGRPAPAVEEKKKLPPVVSRPADSLLPRGTAMITASAESRPVPAPAAAASAALVTPAARASSSPTVESDAADVADVEDVTDVAGAPEATLPETLSDDAPAAEAVSEPAATPLTREQRERIMNDALVQRAVELFGGELLAIDWRRPARS